MKIIEPDRGGGEGPVRPHPNPSVDRTCYTQFDRRVILAFGY